MNLFLIGADPSRLYSPEPKLFIYTSAPTTSTLKLITPVGLTSPVMVRLLSLPDTTLTSNSLSFVA